MHMECNKTKEFSRSKKMLSRLIKTLVVVIIAFATIQTSSARYSENPKLGINVGGLGKLTTSIPFTDIFKSAKGWFTSCEYDWRAQQPIDPGCTKKTSLNSQEQDQLQIQTRSGITLTVYKNIQFCQEDKKIVFVKSADKPFFPGANAFPVNPPASYS